MCNNTNNELTVIALLAADSLRGSTERKGTRQREKDRKREKTQEAYSVTPVGKMIEGTQPSPNKTSGPWVLVLLPDFRGQLIYPAHTQA